MSRALMFVCTLMLISAALTEETPKDQAHGTVPNHNGSPMHNSNPGMDYNNMFPNPDYSNMNPNQKPALGEMPKQHNHTASKSSDTPKAPDMKMPEKPEIPANFKN